MLVSPVQRARSGGNGVPLLSLFILEEMADLSGSSQGGEGDVTMANKRS